MTECRSHRARASDSPTAGERSCDETERDVDEDRNDGYEHGSSGPFPGNEESRGDERHRNGRLPPERRQHESQKEEEERCSASSERLDDKSEPHQEQGVGRHAGGGEEVAERIGACDHETDDDGLGERIEMQTAQGQHKHCDEREQEREARRSVHGVEIGAAAIGECPDQPVDGKSLCVLLGKRAGRQPGRRASDLFVRLDVACELLSDAARPRRPGLCRKDDTDPERGNEQARARTRQSGHRGGERTSRSSMLRGPDVVDDAIIPADESDRPSGADLPGPALSAPGEAMNRVFDVALAGVGLAVGSPLLAAAAIAAKLEDRGPVLYRQTRVGKDGVDFELLKLRTMVVGAEKIGAGFAVDKGDSRITGVGRILRKLSLDELPQLWNVVRGEMSIVGPRPTLRYQVDRYDERQRHRLDVLPGITGWAQIHGRAALPWAERIELDLWYVEHRSALVDLKILLRTPFALFGGTYKGETGGWKAGS